VESAKEDINRAMPAVNHHGKRTVTTARSSNTASPAALTGMVDDVHQVLVAQPWVERVADSTDASDGVPARVEDAMAGPVSCDSSMGESSVLHAAAVP
jgi:hypothetical protein